MKLLITFLAVLLVLLQYKLWIGDDGIRDVLELRDTVEEQRIKNRQVKQRNDVLQAEVDDLKTGLDVVEAKARSELGMIKEGETFIHIVDNDSKNLAKQ